MTIRRTFPIAMALAGVLSACSDGGREPDDKIVDIAGIVAPIDGKNEFIGGLDRIQRDGWLDAELAKKGWKVNWVPVPPAVGGPVVNEGFAAKTIDVALYGDLPAVIAMAGGVDLKLVTTSGAGTNIYIAVGAGSKARTLADLKGKRVALHRGRPWEAGFARYAEAQGLKLEDFKIINTNAQAGTAALTSGKVDAIVLIQSEAYVLEEKGLARVLWSTKDAPESWKMLGGTFARTAFAEANPEIVQIVVDALVRQSRWSSDEANRSTVVSWGTAFGAPVSAVEKDMANSKLPWRERYSPIPGQALQDHFAYVADYAAKTGVTSTKVDVSNLIDRSYVNKSLVNLNFTGWWQDPPLSK